MQRSGLASFFGIDKWYKESESLIYNCSVVRNRVDFFAGWSQKGSSIVFERNAGIKVWIRAAGGRRNIL